MSKGSANELSLGNLHNTLTRVYTKILTRYENKLDEEATEQLTSDNLEDEMVEELVDSGVFINPAMLTAVAKFLKDNSISFDSEELEKLGSLERRLQDKQKRRANVVNLDNIPLVNNG